MFKKLKELLSGVLLIVLAVWLLFGGRATSDISALDRLPDHDYISEINELIKQKRFGEAKTLCEDVIALGLPCADKAQALKDQSEKESKKIFNRLYKAAKGFVTGEPDKSLEELGGSVVSDMVMYGDIRDLAKQGYYKITGKETDYVIVALAAAGLLTEFVDIADWFPAIMKAFRKVGAISDALGQYIVKICKNIGITKRADAACKVFFTNMKTLLDKSGFIRSANIIKHARSADDIAILAKSAEHAPHATHLVARAANQQTCELISAVNKHKDSPALMKKIAQKGAKSIRLITRTGKILHKGHLAQFLRQLLGWYFYLINLVLIVCGGFFIYLGLKNVKNIFPFKKKKA